MRTLFFFPGLLVTFLVLACDSKPSTPPAPKIDTAPTADKAHAPIKAPAPREESPQQSGY